MSWPPQNASLDPALASSVSPLDADDAGDSQRLTKMLEKLNNPGDADDSFLVGLNHGDVTPSDRSADIGKYRRSPAIAGDSRRLCSRRRLARVARLKRLLDYPYSIYDVIFGMISRLISFLYVK